MLHVLIGSFFFPWKYFYLFRNFNSFDTNGFWNRTIKIKVVKFCSQFRTFLFQILKVYSHLWSFVSMLLTSVSCLWKLCFQFNFFLHFRNFLCFQSSFVPNLKVFFPMHKFLCFWLCSFNIFTILFPF